MNGQKNWEDFYTKNNRFHLEPHPFFPSVVNVFKAHSVVSVLDLGCGSGRHLIPLAENGFDVQGLDFSPAAVDTAQKWLQEKNLPGRASIADIHQEIKAFSDASFDGVFAVDSLSYQSTTEFIETLSQINRLLRTGGLLFLVVPSKLAPKQENFKQFHFNEEALKLALQDTFKILEMRLDQDNHFSVIGQEIPS